MTLTINPTRRTREQVAEAAKWMAGRFPVCPETLESATQDAGDQSCDLEHDEPCHGLRRLDGRAIAVLANSAVDLAAEVNRLRLLLAQAGIDDPNGTVGYNPWEA